MELHRPPARPRGPRSPSPPRSAVTAVTSNPPLDLLRYRVQRVVAGGGELAPAGPASRLSDPSGGVRRTVPGLPCDRLAEQGQLAARVLHHGLQAQAHAEGWQPAQVQLVQQLAQPKSAGRPRPGDSTTRSGANSSSAVRGKPGRAGSAPPLPARGSSQPACARTSPGGPPAAPAGRRPAAAPHPRWAPAAARRPRRRFPAAAAGRRPAFRAGRRLQLGLPLLRQRVGVEQQRRARPHRGDPVPDVRRAQGEAGVHAAVEADQPTAPPYQRRGARSWSSMNCIAHVLGAPVTVTAHMWVRKASSASSPGRQPSDVVDRVDEAAVHLDLPPADHPHAARHADPRLVVAVHVGAHGQLRLLLGRVEQGADVGGVLQRVGRRARSCRRSGRSPPESPGHPHVHLGRRADQALPSPRLKKNSYGAGLRRRSRW